MPAQTIRYGSSPPGRPMRWGLLLGLVCALLAGAVVLAQSGAIYDLHWNVVTGGGYWGSGTNYQIHFSFGQPSTVGYSSGGTYQVGQGFWMGDLQPTAVDLTSLAAVPAGTGILVTWETASEQNNLGFHLYRQTSLEGPPERLNQVLIPSQAPGQGMGASYAFLDPAVQPGVRYFYTLEDVDADGRRTPHGPVQAVAPYAVFLPLVGK